MSLSANYLPLAPRLPTRFADDESDPRVRGEAAPLIYRREGLCGRRLKSALRAATTIFQNVARKQRRDDRTTPADLQFGLVRVFVNWRIVGSFSFIFLLKKVF